MPQATWRQKCSKSPRVNTWVENAFDRERIKGYHVCSQGEGRGSDRGEIGEGKTKREKKATLI